MIKQIGYRLKIMRLGIYFAFKKLLNSQKSDHMQIIGIDESQNKLNIKHISDDKNYSINPRQYCLKRR